MAYLFIIIVLVIFFGSHWVAYRFFVNVFSVEKRRTKVILRSVLVLLPFSFIGSMILLHFWNNGFIRFLYFIAGLWLGFLINLLVFCFCCTVIFLVAKIFKKQYSHRGLNRVGLVLIVLLTLLGLINVFVPSVKNVEIEIPALPEEWKGKKIVQISDIHLGAILGNSFFTKVVDQINIINPDVVVITGDLFDGNDGFVEDNTKLLNQINAKQGVYYVTGNHEVYLGVEKALEILSYTKIKVLNDEIVDLAGLQLIGLSHPAINERKIFPAELIEQYDEAKPSILLYHLPNDIGDENNTRNDIYFSPNTNFEMARKLGIDLQLSGHTHKGQIFPFNFITNWIYKGFDDGLERNGNFQIYINSGTGVWGPTLRTVSRPEITLIELK